MMITTVTQLENLPLGAILKDRDGHAAEVVGVTVSYDYQDWDDQPRVNTYGDGEMEFDDALDYYGPFEVLFDPREESI